MTGSRPVPNCGSIPAPAGEPVGQVSRCRLRGVYPRACGGTRAARAAAERCRGLSPRLRGNRRHRAGRCGQPGSIPAPAGEPAMVYVNVALAAVYPRACGGTVELFIMNRILSGLSPRLRGNRGTAGAGPVQRRSIPAPAGEPSPPSAPPVTVRVYPRACGGTNAESCGLSCQRGLSPRLRGNPPLGPPTPFAWRSIPAPAGEPLRWSSPIPPKGVYPRACGGTHRSLTSSSLSKVYPRACGGTARGGVAAVHLRGLSPRLRGNPRPNSLRRPA